MFWGAEGTPPPAGRDRVHSAECRAHIFPGAQLVQPRWAEPSPTRASRLSCDRADLRVTPWGVPAAGWVSALLVRSKAGFTPLVCQHEERAGLKNHGLGTVKLTSGFLSKVSNDAWGAVPKNPQPPTPHLHSTTRCSCEWTCYSLRQKCCLFVWMTFSPRVYWHTRQVLLNTKHRNFLKLEEGEGGLWSRKAAEGEVRV